MATEELYTGIVNIEVYGSDAPQRIAAIVQQIKTAMIDLGAIRADSGIGAGLQADMDKGQVSVERLMRTLTQLATAGEQGPDTRAMREYIVATDLAISKTDQLHRAQAAGGPRASFEDRTKGAVAHEQLQQQAAFESKIRDLERSQQEFARDIAKNYGYKQGLGAVGLGEEPRKPQTNVLGSDKYPGRVNKDQVEAEIEAVSARPPDPVREAKIRLSKALDANAAAEESERISGQGFTKDPAANYNLKATQQEVEAANRILATALERHAVAENTAATQAERDAERQRIQGDPDRMKLLRAEGSEFLEGSGVDTTQSLRMQELRTEEERLALAQRSLRLKYDSVSTEAEYARVMEQKTALEKRITANTEAMARQQYKEGGRGGFAGGLLGNFDGSPQGVTGRDIGFQAGQAVKFYALYSALSMAQQALTGLITLSAEYSLAVTDLAVAMNVSTEEAEKSAEGYAAIGAQYGTGPMEALQGAAKFSRTFRDEDQRPLPGVGEQGARISSAINILEGPQRIERGMADLVALMGAFDVGPSGGMGVFDTAQGVSQRYGFKAGEVIGGAGALGDLAKESGYDLPELIALIASVMQATGTTSDAVGGDVKRILGSQDSSDLNAVFERFNVDLNANFEERIFQLATAFDQLPEEQRAREITNIANDPRTGATFAAMLNTAIQARQTAAQTGDSAGLVDEQVTKRLGEFGGELKKLQANLTQAAIAMGDLGIIDLLTTIAHAFNGLASVLVVVARAVGQLPDPLLEGAAAIALMVVAAKALAATRGAFAGSDILGSLGIGAAGRTARAGRAAEGIDDLRRARGTARAAGDAALTSSLTSQIVAAEKAAVANKSLTSSIVGLGASALKTAGPLVAVMAGFTIAGDSLAQIEGYDAAKTDAGAQNKILTGGVTDRAQYASAIEAMKADREKILKTDDGISGFFTSGKALQAVPIVGSYASSFFPDASSTLEKQAKEIEDRVKWSQEQLRAFDEKLAATGTESTPASEYFGDDYRLTTYRIEQAKASGMGASSITDRLGQLIGGGNLDRMFPKEQGEKGVTEYMKLITDRIEESTNPLEQQDLFAQLRTTVSGLKGVAEGGGENADAARQAISSANRAYLDSMTSNIEAKIANIKAIQGDGPKAINQIKKLVSQGIAETTLKGDVGATVKLLSLVDKQFYDTYRALLVQQIKVIKEKVESLQAAARASSVAASIAREIRSGELAGTQDPHAIGDNLVDQRAAEDRQRALDAANAELETLDKAAGLSTFSGSAFGNDAKDKPEDVEAARIAALARPGDDVQQATIALKLARYQLGNAKSGTVEYWNAFKAVKDAQYELAQAVVGENNARIGAGAVAGDSYSQAKANLAMARNTLRAAVKGTTEYWNALSELHSAQYELAQLVLEKANNYRILRSDVTDPVEQANIAVKAAQDKLNADRARGASSATIVADQVALKQAQASAKSTQWNQTFGDMQTNYELNRISLSAYLKYLNSQKAYLEAVKNKTRDQVEQLNQVDQALKALADGLQGQWNLGDIKVPTPYEARRAMEANGAAMQTTNNITINGADTAAVMQMLQGALGVSVIQSATTAPKKV